jgi:hypothetical protein
MAIGPPIQLLAHSFVGFRDRHWVRRLVTGVDVPVTKLVDGDPRQIAVRPPTPLLCEKEHIGIAGQAEED